MKRDLPRLAAREFDLLVVGGGIYGLIAAYDAAQRGLSVALVERGDFGAATSFNHLKTIHGGLRYLQTGDVRRMRESIRERRAFARIAPRFVAPLAFVMPTCASLTRNAFAMRAALALEALAGWDRNAGLDSAHRLPAGRIIPASAFRDLLGDLAPASAPAALWYDYETVRGDRLTLAFALAAANHGAVLANYVQAMEPRCSEAKRWIGVRARDIPTGNEFDVRARVVLNAAGPWALDVLGRTAMPGRWPQLKAMNLVTCRLAPRAALVASTRGGRALVLLPWQGRTLIGTGESRGERSPEEQQAGREEMLAFLTEVNDTFPTLNLEPDEVTLVHRGIVPAVNDSRGLSLRPHSSIVDHASYGVEGLVSIIGVKYTTARAVAQRTVDLVLTKLGRAPVPCRTATSLLPGAAINDADPADGVAQAIQEEMALTLADVVIRRTGAGAAGYPGNEIVAAHASRMQQALGWSAEKVAEEIEAVKKFYEIR